MDKVAKGILRAAYPNPVTSQWRIYNEGALIDVYVIQEKKRGRKPNPKDPNEVLKTKCSCGHPREKINLFVGIL